jgi:hypothetical protein
MTVGYNKGMNNVQICWHPQFGLLLRIEGVTSPATMDYVEQTYGQAALDDAMENPYCYREITELPTLRPITRAVRMPNPSLLPTLALSCVLESAKKLREAVDQYEEIASRSDDK